MGYELCINYAHATIQKIKVCRFKFTFIQGCDIMFDRQPKISSYALFFKPRLKNNKRFNLDDWASKASPTLTSTIEI